MRKFKAKFFLGVAGGLLVHVFYCDSSVVVFCCFNHILRGDIVFHSYYRTKYDLIVLVDISAGVPKLSVRTPNEFQDVIHNYT